MLCSFSTLKYSSLLLKVQNFSGFVGFLLLSDMASPRANQQMAGKRRFERNILSSGNQALYAGPSLYWMISHRKAFSYDKFMNNRGERNILKKKIPNFPTLMVNIVQQQCHLNGLRFLSIGVFILGGGGGVHNMLRVRVCGAYMDGLLGPKFFKQGSIFGRISLNMGELSRN